MYDNTSANLVKSFPDIKQSETPFCKVLCRINRCDIEADAVVLDSNLNFVINYAGVNFRLFGFGVLDYIY